MILNFKRHPFYNKIAFPLFILIVVFACNSPKQQLPPELQKTIDHYSHSETDTLKLKAAWFLIKNMNNCYTTDSQELRTHYAFLDTLFKNEKNANQLDYRQTTATLQKK